VNIKYGELSSEVNEMKSGYKEAVDRAEQLEVFSPSSLFHLLFFSDTTPIDIVLKLNI
jgi:hypothetical protein